MRRRRRTNAILAAACVLPAVLVPATPAAAQTITFPTQAMEGNRTVSPGAVLRAGYSFTMPGNHAAAAVAFRLARVKFAATCVSGGAAVPLVVPLDTARYVDPAGDGSNWYPIGDQASARSYQGSITIPDACAGGSISLRLGGSFGANLVSSDNTDPVRVRWHYSANGSAGGWSSTNSYVPAQAPRQPKQPAESHAPTQIIAKVDLADGYTIDDITSAFPVAVDDGGLASRGIYLLTPTDPAYLDNSDLLKKLADRIKGAHGVLYAQVNLTVHLADTQFHGWPYGSPTVLGADPSPYYDQAAVQQLRLATAHASSRGAGTVVAVLDTGADPQAPALAGHLLPGWNYLRDNADTSDTGRGPRATCVGHGTFVAGLVALVAPDAKIIPQRVLNPSGYGTIYGAAQAIIDATAAGANVINLSFGSDVPPSWNVLKDAISRARAAGVVVVAAVGNDGTTERHYPAAQPEALSASALAADASSLADFSDRGSWVDVAAPGEQVVGPLPGGTYATWAGTSMAAPFVAGEAALIKSEVPTIKPDKLFDAIGHTAAKLPQNPIHFGAIDIVSALSYALAHH